MPTIEAKAKAAELQRQIATLTGHDLAQVKPYGKHLLIQMHRDDSVDTIARLTKLARNSYSSAFRSHTGRWEPLPGTGDLATTADLVVSLLGPYFDPRT
jgi:hypothetical protein